jgi:RNA polymerase sigma-70 factor (ECF subfamily)
VTAVTARQSSTKLLAGLINNIGGLAPGRINRGVAVAMRDGPMAGLEIIDSILGRGELLNYALAHSARGELLRRCGRIEEALITLQTAIALTKHESEKRFLERKVKQLRG